MADQVEEVKSKTDIVQIIGEHVDLKKAGRNYKALCPFHAEKLPSFMVSPELQMFKCFGCGESGDVFTFLQKHEAMDFPEALQLLAERAQVELKPFRSGQQSEKQKLYEINKLASHFYHYLLLNHAVGRSALKYLTEGRGLKIPTIKKFQLGYSPDAPLAIKKYLVEKKKIRVDDLVRVGIVYKSAQRVFDRFRGRVIFPLHDHRGNVAGFAGRLMPGSRKDLAKYINTPDTPVYHKSNLLYGLNVTRTDVKKAKSAVVVEGELDMISTWQVGIKNVVAIKGSAVTQGQARLLSRFADKVIFALDADVAGDKAVRRGITTSEQEGLEVAVAILGEFKDPDDAARRDPKKLKKLIGNPIGVWDFIIDSIFSRHSVKTGVGKAKVSKEVVPVLSSISDTIVRAHYAGVVAKKLSVSADDVLRQVDKSSEDRVSPGETIEHVLKPETKSRRELLEERLMTLGFQNDPKVLLKKDIEQLFQTPLLQKILQKYKRYSKGKKKFDPSEFSESLPKELFKGFSSMILSDIKDFITSGKREVDAEKEFNMVIKELRILAIKKRLSGVSKGIRELESKKQNQKLKGEERKFAKLASELSKLEAND